MSSIHIEAPHATQATQAELAAMVERIRSVNIEMDPGVVFTDLRGMGLLHSNERANVRLEGLIFHREKEKRDVMFECHPSDLARLDSILLEKLAKTYDFGTKSLAENLHQKTKFPTLLDGSHRYVGGDLNRPSGTYNEIGDCDNSMKWKAWNRNEKTILDQGTGEKHVAVCLHSMDVREHRQKENAEGELELDREIIIGTRYGQSATPEVLEPFYKAFAAALETAFEGDAPKIKIDLEFLGNPVLKNRRAHHLDEGRDVHYIQIEFMKYLLAGDNADRITHALEEGLKALEAYLLSERLEIPSLRESFSAEYEAWHDRVEARNWTFQSVHEISDDGEETPFIRLSAQQRDFLRVEVGDSIIDANGKSWLVKAQKSLLERRYTEEDQVSSSDPNLAELVLARK